MSEFDGADVVILALAVIGAAQVVGVLVGLVLGIISAYRPQRDR